MRRIHWLDGVTLLVGLWLLVALWLLDGAGGIEGLDAARWTFGVVGLAVIYLSLGILFNFSAWEEWANVVLGLWLIVSPYALGYHAVVPAVWTALLCGAILVAAGVRRGLQGGRGGRA